MRLHVPVEDEDQFLCHICYRESNTDSSNGVIECCAVELPKQKLGENIVGEKHHDCTPDFAKNESAILMQRIKEKITEPTFPAVPSTYNKAIAKMSNSDVSNIIKFPQFNNIKSSLYRYRNKTAKLTKISCYEAKDVQVPDSYEEFLLADYQHEGVRIIIFCSKKSRELIKKVKDFFSDGTFKSCPSCFKRLYATHRDLGSDRDATNIVPLMYCKAYVTLFELIKTQISEWEPINFKTDFVNAAIKAINYFQIQQLPAVITIIIKVFGKKAKELELTQCEKIKRRKIELSAVLPLLPRNELLNGWKYITRHDIEDPQLLKIRSYMEKQWIKSDSLVILSVYGQRHCTNNFWKVGTTS
ncbi:hypothetical protein HW555_011308 [Spodoptera exigua]|uniref:Uncharacterized protein n=1 Tax=Spodoptera exigua TaxID=7107 RepID=A0A835L4R4_SPOEX|nr:hypothetical protein HW555_011308 [Spodoptera exigua]